MTAKTHITSYIDSLGLFREDDVKVEPYAYELAENRPYSGIFSKVKNKRVIT